jgi:hypothetical protein
MGSGSGIRDPGSGIRKTPIPDPGVKNAPDPGSGSETRRVPVQHTELRYRTLQVKGPVTVPGDVGSAILMVGAAVCQVHQRAPRCRNRRDLLKRFLIVEGESQ